MRNVSGKSYRQETPFYVQQIFSWKSRRVRNNVEECGTARQATDDNKAHAYCMLDN